MISRLIRSDKGEPIQTLKGFLGKAKRDIVLFSPYIRTNALKELQLKGPANITIVTSLRVQDLWSGASDLDLYPYSKESSIKVFINNGIHLKAYVNDWESCIFGSSNLTNRGLGVTEKFNLELNGVITDLDIETKLYLRMILSNSILMDDSIFESVRAKVEELPARINIEELDFANISREKDYLISSLPMSKSINRLYKITSNHFETGDEEEISCALHDAALFGLPTNIDFDNYIEVLKVNFFKSEFIRDLLSFIDEKERYFGEVKEWIQSHCADVPVPSRRDLTGNIQVLYEWITFLGDGKYVVDRPRHSERIYRK